MLLKLLQRAVTNRQNTLEWVYNPTAHTCLTPHHLQLGKLPAYGWSMPCFPLMLDRFIQQYQAALNNQQRLLLLDLGCGAAAMLLYALDACQKQGLKADGIDYLGVDVSEANLTLARTLFQRIQKKQPHTACLKACNLDLSQANSHRALEDCIQNMGHTTRPALCVMSVGLVHVMPEEGAKNFAHCISQLQKTAHDTPSQNIMITTATPRHFLTAGSHLEKDAASHPCGFFLQPEALTALAQKLKATQTQHNPKEQRLIDHLEKAAHDGTPFAACTETQLRCLFPGLQSSLLETPDVLKRMARDYGCHPQGMYAMAHTP